jgi:hypothetical protein
MQFIEKKFHFSKHRLNGYKIFINNTSLKNRPQTTIRLLCLYLLEKVVALGFQGC